MVCYKLQALKRDSRRMGCENSAVFTDLYIVVVAGLLVPQDLCRANRLVPSSAVGMNDMAPGILAWGSAC